MVGDQMKHLATPIMLTVTGSRLYGNYTEESDWDFRGVVLPPTDHVLGMRENPKGTYNSLQGISDIIPLDLKHQMVREDVEFQEIRKFFQLCLKSNPNIIELLFCDNMISSPIWDIVKEKRDIFLSQKALHSFSGYAHAQLKRIKNHKEWIDEIPEEPDREKYGLPKQPNFSNSKLNGLRQLSNEELENHISKNMLEELKVEFTFQDAMKNYEKYVTHRENRNEKRFALESKYGWDCKHGSHLLRLFYEARRLLLTGELVFPLPEIDIVRDVRNGKWSYDRLIEFSENIDSDLKSIVDSGNCVLPHKPDANAVDELAREIIWNHLKNTLT